MCNFSFFIFIRIFIQYSYTYIYTIFICLIINVYSIFILTYFWISYSFIQYFSLFRSECGKLIFFSFQGLTTVPLNLFFFQDKSVIVLRSPVPPCYQERLDEGLYTELMVSHLSRWKTEPRENSVNLSKICLLGGQKRGEIYRIDNRGWFTLHNLGFKVLLTVILNCCHCKNVHSFSETGGAV